MEKKINKGRTIPMLNEKKKKSNKYVQYYEN